MNRPLSDTGMWRIGELADSLGITQKTLRHYERMGLLQPPKRTARRYRMYDEEDLARARHVIDLRRLGLSLEEIRGLLKGDKSGRTRQQRLLGLLDEKLREIEESLAVLQGRRDDMAARYLALLNAAPRENGNCTCAALVSCNCKNRDSKGAPEGQREELTVNGLLRRGTSASKIVSRTA